MNTNQPHRWWTRRDYGSKRNHNTNTNLVVVAVFRQSNRTLTVTTVIFATPTSQLPSSPSSPSLAHHLSHCALHLRFYFNPCHIPSGILHTHAPTNRVHAVISVSLSDFWSTTKNSQFTTKTCWQAFIIDIDIDIDFFVFLFSGRPQTVNAPHQKSFN